MKLFHFIDMYEIKVDWLTFELWQKKVQKKKTEAMGKNRNKVETKLRNWISGNQKKEKTETKWKQSWGIELWREGAGVPIPVTFPPIETIAICFFSF